MISVFPACATLIEPKNYRITEVPVLLRSQYDDGYTRQAPRTHRHRREREVAYLLCDGCYQNFHRWWHDDLNGGSSAFHWTEPESGKLRRARILGGDITYTNVTKAVGTFRADFVIETYD